MSQKKHSNKQVYSPQSWKKRKKKKSTIHRGESAKKRLHTLGHHKEMVIKAIVSVVLFGLIGGSLFGFGFFFWISRDLPNPNKLSERILAESTKIYDRAGEHLLYEIHGDTKRTLVQLEDIPPYVSQAFIAVEDKNFYEHKGFSLWAIFRTVVTNALRNQKAGGSTLTQQFVKNAILTSEKTYTRKIKEVILSYQIEKKFTKDEILQLYFNEIPFGSTAYGIESASQNYFAKSSRDLTLAESAILAAMVKAPTYYSPYGNNIDALIARQHFALQEMLDEGFITQEEFDAAVAEELVFERQLEDIEAPHFVLFVREQLVEEFGERTVEQGGLRVVTTLDYDKQKIAEEAVADHAESNLENWEASNASLVSIDTKTGEILAMVGSTDYFNDEIDGQVNVALRPRQPGSSFKPIVYMSAFGRGYSPESVVFDAPTVFATETGKDYEPKNYDLEERGPVSLRTSLQGSLNIPAVKALYLTGIGTVLDNAEKLGYTTLGDRSRFGLSLVLGGGEVTLLEHVFAYATLAREGERPQPVTILEVQDNRGKTLHTFEKPEKEQVLEAEPIRVLNNVLSDDPARSYVFGAGSLLTLPGRPVAAKTGTTNDYRDAWTIGYTPSVATGVWVGNNDNSAMRRGASGYTVAAPIWNQYMREVLSNTLVESFQEPDIKPINKPMLDGSTGTGVTVRIDKVSDKLATEHTPVHVIEEKTFRELHNILHYVNTNDPLGPVPSNPAQDPQYNNWEAGIVAWAEANEIEIKEDPPTEFDDVHLPGNEPELTFTSPTIRQTISDSVPVTIEWNTVLPFKQLDIYVDDILLYTDTTQPSNPFSIGLALDPEQFTAGTHSVKAVVRDEVENTKLDFVLFTIE